MAAYVVAQMHVHDVAKYLDYASKVGATISNHGGKILAANEADVREGEPPFTRTIIGEFPTLQAAHDWYDCEEYQAIVSLSRSARVWAGAQPRVLIFEESTAYLRS